MRLSTLTQRSEVKAAEERRELAVPIAVIAAIVALVLAFGGHWLLALGVAAAGGLALFNTTMELRSLGNPESSEAFYRLADPRRPLELPSASADPVSSREQTDVRDRG
jgi:small neutral amino acid transporter SnatA (MarC family)